VANKKNQSFLYSLTSDHPKVSKLMVFLIGCAMTLVFAPAEWAILAPVLMLPLLFIALSTSPRDAASHFFWFGFGMFLTGTSWIYISVHVFGNAALWIAVLLMVGLSLIMATLLWLAGRTESHGDCCSSAPRPG
jgi:apolipoprotein N-acyltransferase